MNSRDVSNFVQAQGLRNELDVKGKQRRAGEGVSFATHVTIYDKLPESFSSSDYRSEPHLENLPLAIRSRYKTTKWPVQNRPGRVSVGSQSRNIGNTLWRRYPDGALDYQWSLQLARDCIRRYEENFALNENDALVLASIYPDKYTVDIPKEIVRLKAFLSEAERKTLRGLIDESEVEAYIRDVANIG